MRAAMYDRYGPPDVLYVGTAAVPVPRPGEVLVRVHAVSVNGGELHLRSGGLRLMSGRSFPKRMGIDFVGEVAEVGAEVRGLAVGDRVWGILSRKDNYRGKAGSAAEFVTVQAHLMSHTPKGLDLVQAAALPVGTTAITALRDKARLQAGERLLVRGAAGGVGSVAVQLGKAFGAHVTALAGGKNLDLVRELGADEAFDYAVTGPGHLGRFDVVFDTVGSRLPAYRRLLTPRGRMVTIAPDTGNLVGSLSYILVSTVYGRRRVQFFSGAPTRDLFSDLTAYVESGAIRPVVDTVHPLTAIAEAHRALEAGGVRGKHVIQIV
ncbi:NAD(P)-dependent alcohol dehydrogenase [Sphaerisporangium sp. TRM90804]|uniref:NAD(P)-dependent alcohol dehydrogenase n=1 Tax=Sphaerisporangium sp. TRM90804 TaxID=3031113 RepID=UPI00244AC1ED|nr:NAD(P)-dependent alcohol dehydrogenase [Sphaerisporangium sp. TRM90804]MDH2426590.1 NAD(P)-dependent alcohol dehydrogenase [Sphaerisporangium sp. TRM90804]